MPGESVFLSLGGKRTRWRVKKAWAGQAQNLENLVPGKVSATMIYTQVLDARRSEPP